MTASQYKDRRDYVRQTFAQEPKAMQNIRAAMKNPDDQINVPPEDGRLLQLLVRLVNAKKIVEIGTLGGYSSTWMAQAMPKGGKIWTCEYEDRRADIAERVAGLHRRDPRHQRVMRHLDQPLGLAARRAGDIHPA